MQLSMKMEAIMEAPQLTILTVGDSHKDTPLFWVNYKGRQAAVWPLPNKQVKLTVGHKQVMQMSFDQFFKWEKRNRSK